MYGLSVLVSVASLLAACGMGESSTPSRNSGGASTSYAAPALPAPGDAVTASYASSLAPLVEHVRDTVVGVTTRTEVSLPEDMRDLFHRFFGGQVPHEELTGLGSGVVIDARGVVLTNNHVVAGAQEVLVTTADGKRYLATVQGTDRATDIALLRMRDVDHDLPVAHLGSSDALRVGDYLVAIGNPFGLSLTVTNGILSAKSRVIGVGPYDEFLQTDAAINPGNSGGPLFDLAGNVVGITTAIAASGQGIGFAVPIDLAKSLLPQLETKGKVVRGFLAVGVQDLTPALARAFGLSATQGAVVAAVVPEGAGAQAGIEEGDVVVSLDGAPITSAMDFSRRIAMLPPGHDVELRLFRNGKPLSKHAKLAERPEAGPVKEQRGAATPEKMHATTGLVLQPLPSAAAIELGVSRGVLVVEVAPGSRADRAGVQPGDVIVEVGRAAVGTPAELAASMSGQPGRPALLRVLRRGDARYLVIPVE